MKIATQEDNTMSMLKIIFGIATEQEPPFFKRERDGKFFFLRKEEDENDLFPEKNEGNKDLSMPDIEEVWVEILGLNRLPNSFFLSRRLLLNSSDY